MLIFCFYISKIATTPLQTVATGDNEISTSNERYTDYCIGIQQPAIIRNHYFGFQLLCDPSVVTDDLVVKHPRELQSKLIESRKIGHDLEATSFTNDITTNS